MNGSSGKASRWYSATSSPIRVRNGSAVSIMLEFGFQELAIPGDGAAEPLVESELGFPIQLFSCLAGAQKLLPNFMDELAPYVGFQSRSHAIQNPAHQFQNSERRLGREIERATAQTGIGTQSLGQHHVGGTAVFRVQV